MANKHNHKEEKDTCCDNCRDGIVVRSPENYYLGGFSITAGFVCLMAMLLALSATNMYIYNRAEANYKSVNQQLDRFQSSIAQQEAMSKNLSSIVIENNSQTSRLQEVLSRDIASTENNMVEIRELLRRIDRNVFVIANGKNGEISIDNQELRKDIAELQKFLGVKK